VGAARRADAANASKAGGEGGGRLVNDFSGVKRAGEWAGGEQEGELWGVCRAAVKSDVGRDDGGLEVLSYG